MTNLNTSTLLRNIEETNTTICENITRLKLLYDELEYMSSRLTEKVNDPKAIYETVRYTLYRDTYNTLLSCVNDAYKTLDSALIDISEHKNRRQQVDGSSRQRDRQARI